MSFAYMGKILLVDLSNGEIKEEAIPDSVYKDYLSGIGLGAYICYKDIPAKADPLGPENILGFVSGLMTGSGYPFSGRWIVCGKSPLTGTWGDANCGGNFAPAIKRCGYDGIFFKGISEKPVYLYIDKNNRAELKEAKHLWGIDAVETEQMLIKEIGGNPRVACIGPAGEKLSLISGICNDRGRIAARSGLGAVMGSKRLKALVLEGSNKVKIHDRDSVNEIRKKINKLINLQILPIGGKTVAGLGWLLGILPLGLALDGILFKMLLKKWGTVFMNRMSVGMGDSPLKNWAGTTKDYTMKKTRPTDPDIFLEREKKRYACYACPIGCGAICEMSGKYKETHRPEYETVLALGGLCMNNDIESIFYLNELLNRAGMDTISAGATAAFAIECYENGIITKKDTGGIELRWGNFDAIIKIIELMITREGIGDILADGVKTASQKIGAGSEEYAIHAGGQELPMHDGRNDPGFALHYSVEATPGRHTIGAWMYYEMFQLWKVIKSYPAESLFYPKRKRFTIKEKAIKAAACSQLTNVINGTGLCMFGMFTGIKRLMLFQAINAATGWEMTPEEYMETGARIQTLKQAFNIRQGVDPKTIRPSKRALGEPPMKKGMNRGRTVPLDKLVTEYYGEMGWDRETGKPLPETLEKYNIIQ